MARGYKTGGRVAGTPNKRTAEVAERLAALGCDPIEGMARIAMDTAQPVELRLRAYAELAPYVAAKRRAVEITLGSVDLGAELEKARERVIAGTAQRIEQSPPEQAAMAGLCLVSSPGSFRDCAR